MSLQRSSISERKINKQIVIRNEDKEQLQPLVVIGGWVNSNMKHLYKYSEIFERRNFTTICVTSSVVNTIFRFHTAGKKDSMRLRKVVLSQIDQNKERAIIFCCFSGGGVNLYYHLATDTKLSPNLGMNIRGSIMDSAPVVPRSTSPKYIKEIISVYIGNKLLAYVAGNVAKLMFLIVFRLDKKYKDIVPNLENDTVNSPQLLLFCKDDKIAPYEDVVDFIKARENKGIDVTYKCWENSEHVSHLKFHKNEYVETVNNFIDKCLNANEEQEYSFFC